MKNAAKTIFSLILVIVFLIACFALLTLGYVAAWIQTYRAFTDKTLIAQVTISEQKIDNLGTYADVDILPYESESALSTLFTGKVTTKPSQNVIHYKLYGDTIYVGGPIVKFQDSLILLNFKTMYKFAKVYARYDLDNEKEVNRTSVIASTYDLNGGLADWKPFYDNYVSDSLIGKIYRVFVDTTQVSEPGMFVGNTEQKFNVYVTNTGFLWNVIK